MDNLGDYMKELEGEESSRKAKKGKPLIVRLDGRAFHTFTKGLKRPYDERLTQLMQLTTQHLVETTNALIGYTQSDEITLIWYIDNNSTSQYLFDGRYQKLCSICAATATGFFNRKMLDVLPEKTNYIPLFDARAWQVPTLNDAYLALLWREKDAIKNSITMLALTHFSHKSLQKINGTVKRIMLTEIGDPWEAYPSFFKKGSYFVRVAEEIKMSDLSPEDLAKIPEKYRSDQIITRNAVRQVEFPDLSSLSDPLSDPLSVLFPKVTMTQTNTPTICQAALKQMKE
jgi:tRNA(His) 5'-end guanylyltransferase